MLRNQLGKRFTALHPTQSSVLGDEAICEALRPSQGTFQEHQWTSPYALGAANTGVIDFDGV